MVTYNESFNKADSAVLGPDLTWTKFSANDFDANGPSINDGEVSSNSYGVSGGDRTYSSAYSDSFNRSNNASNMGVTDGTGLAGLFGTETWFPAFGTWGINTNKAYQPSGVANAVTLIYAGVSNITVEVTISAGTDAGLCYRWFDNNNYWYTNKAGEVKKRVLGVTSTVFTFTTGAVNDGDVVTADLYGDLHTFYVNGVAAGSFTDSDFDNEPYFGLYSNSSSNSRFDDFRLYYLHPEDVSAFARAEHDTGTTSVYASAKIAAMAISNPENYPSYNLGVSLDSTYTGPLTDNVDTYNGPPGLWVAFEPLGFSPSGCGVYAWITNQHELLSITFTVHPLDLGGDSTYVQGPVLAVSDVLRVDHDAVNNYVSISVNGVECAAGGYVLSDMANPPTFGERGGLSIFGFNDPAPYPPNSDRLDNFETGTTLLSGPVSSTGHAGRASATAQAYAPTLTIANYVRPITPCRWELFDLYTQTALLFPVNPNEGSSPARKKTVTSHSTVAPRGKTLLFEGADEPLQFSWSGIILSQEHFDAFTEWFEMNKQLLLTDDLGRQTYVYLTEFTPERAGSSHHHYRHKYTASAIELDWQ